MDEWHQDEVVALSFFYLLGCLCPIAIEVVLEELELRVLDVDCATLHGDIVLKRILLHEALIRVFKEDGASLEAL